MTERCGAPVADGRPTFYVVAGPNGAGKTTLARSGRFGGASIVDPDDLARRINPDDPDQATFAAAREAMRMIANNLEVGRDFVQETTLDGSEPIRTAERAIEAGYRVELHFVGVNNIRKSRERVAERVAQGGHDIPAADIERRFEQAYRNAERLSAMADSSVFYDNSRRHDPHRIVLERDDRGERLSPDAPAWAGHVASRLPDREPAADLSKEKPMSEERAEALAPARAKSEREGVDERAADLHRRSLQVARDSAARIEDPGDRARAEAIIGRMEETGRQFREGRRDAERDARPAAPPTSSYPNAASRPQPPDAQRQQRDDLERAQRVMQQDQARDAQQRDVQARDVQARDVRGRVAARAERDAERDRDDGRD